MRLYEELIFWEIPYELYDSTILTEISDSHFVCDQLLKGQKINLIYRMSRDGSKSHEFHHKCDIRPNTITFIKSENG